MLHNLAWLKKGKAAHRREPAIRICLRRQRPKPSDARAHLAGDPTDRGDSIKRRAPLVLGGDSFANPDSSGRLELAKWLTEPDHPLTARVIVNRVWALHFGRGLVATVDNFGSQGEAPTHPELLDWLAAQFVAGGWSIKQLHRRIMLSRAYRLRGDPNPAADPENRWVWHFPRRRLEAEAIRDSMLMVSGELDSTPGDAHPFKPWYVKKYSLNGPFHETYPTNKRSVYLMTQRLFKHPFLGLFDGPDTASSNATRNTTNNPGQALYLMNSDFVKAQSAAFADRASEQSGDRVQWIWNRAYGRPATDKENAAALEYVHAYPTEREAWTSLCRAVLISNEFFHVD